MKFSVDIPDDVFWMISRRAEAVDMTVPHFVAQVSARLASLTREPGDPLTVLQDELRAARRTGYRAPHAKRSLATNKQPRVDFTDREMEIALAVMEGKTP